MKSKSLIYKVCKWQLGGGFINKAAFAFLAKTYTEKR